MHCSFFNISLANTPKVLREVCGLLSLKEDKKLSAGKKKQHQTIVGYIDRERQRQIEREKVKRH